MAQAGSVLESPGQRPPVRRHAAHQCDAGGLEPIDQLLRLLGRAGPVGEAETPDRHERFALVSEVARAARHPQGVDEIAPVVLQIGRRDCFVLAGDVVHDR